MREEMSAKKIITAVNWPYEANIGIGAKPIITNPTMLDAADASNATPVPLEVLLTASTFEGFLFNSSLYLSVM